MFWSVLAKSYKEQLRSIWVLLLTVSLAPFFVFVYYLINDAQQVDYDLQVINQDQGAIWDGEEVNLGVEVIQYLLEMDPQEVGIPLSVHPREERKDAVKDLENGSADALVVLPPGFSRDLVALANGSSETSVAVELVGDLSQVGYMVTAVWAGEFITDIVHSISGIPRPLAVTETALGQTGAIDEFDYYMPGIMILALIMLMFTATIALITEVDQQTILRLKLSRLNAVTFLSGVSVIQILVGLIAAILTLLVAQLMGFDPRGSFWVFLLIAALTSVSIIAFSLILAAVVKSVNEVLIIGNFPLFLFMFFTGAAFPMYPRTLFHIGDYALGWNAWMSPVHAIDALRKVLLLEQGIGDIVPELAAILILTLIYFAIGTWAFGRRHLRTD